MHAPPFKRSLTGNARESMRVMADARVSNKQFTIWETRVTKAQLVLNLVPRVQEAVARD